MSVLRLSPSSNCIAEALLITWRRHLVPDSVKSLDGYSATLGPRNFADLTLFNSCLGWHRPKLDMVRGHDYAIEVEAVCSTKADHTNPDTQAGSPPRRVCGVELGVSEP